MTDTTKAPTTPEAALLAAYQSGALTLDQIKAIAAACETIIGGTRTAFDAVQATEPPKRSVILPIATIDLPHKGAAFDSPEVTRRPIPPVE